MRIIIIIVTALAITIAVLAYNVMLENTGSEQPQAVASQTGATSALEVQDKLDKLASALQRYQQTNQELWQQAQLEQARLKKMLVDLNTRLSSLELTGSKPPTDAAVSNSSAGNSESEEVSEGDLVHWMDETLHAGSLDLDSTNLATEQAVQSLVKLPGVILEDMQCGEGFCRATFAHETGKQPAIQDLFGEPPFENEGFTINGPDGRIMAYFTRPGKSLGELRSKVLETKQLGLSR